MTYKVKNELKFTHLAPRFLFSVGKHAIQFLLSKQLNITKCFSNVGQWDFYTD